MIVTIGHASIDKVIVGKEERTQLGGAAVYSAFASKIFEKTGIVTRVGKDFPVEYINMLRRHGIDTLGLRRVKGKSTSFVIEYKENIANYLEYKINVGVFLKPEDIPKLYLDAQGFHLAPMAATKQIKFVNYIRRRSYGIISLNTHENYFKRYRKEILKLIDKVDIFTMNDEEAKKLTNSKSLEHSVNVLKRKKHNIIVITMGVFGSIVIENGEINYSPSLFQPKIVDLTGCGDAYAGAFLACYIKTEDAVKSANIANTVASLVATDWSFEAIKNLKFKSIEEFQEHVVSRQRKISKNQLSLEHFL